MITKITRNVRFHLFQAVSILTTEEGRINERLLAATEPFLKIDRHPNEITGTLWSEFLAIREALTAVEDLVRGAIAGTCLTLSEEQAAALAKRIVTLFADFFGIYDQF
jgi:hypothetical protein